MRFAFAIVPAILIAAFAATCPAAQTTGPDQETTQSIRDRLAMLVNNALTRNAFDDMLSSFSKFNRDRIAEVPFTGHDRVNAAVDRLRQVYRAAYGRDLSISADAFGDAVLAYDEDPNHAIARIAPTGRSAASIPLAREGFVANPWRVEFANPKADLLAQALVRQIGELMREPLPRDRAAGDRLIAQHILAALSEARPANFVQNASAK